MRLALAIIVVTATGSAAAVTTHTTTPRSGLLAGPVSSREPELRATRSLRRRPLAPTSRRSLRGTPFTGQASSPLRLRGSQRWLSTTMYCATGHRTASGAWPEIGMAAGNLWPFGTRLNVPGVGVVTITDRIGWGSDLDIFGGNDPGCEQRALNYGRRRVLVEAVA